MAYELEIEFKKIQFAFEKVKEDVKYLRKENLYLREEIDFLKEKINLNKEKIIDNTKTIKTLDAKTILGHNKTKKFHYGDCPYGKKIAVQNRVFFKNLEEAYKNNYKACVCISERK